MGEPRIGRQLQGKVALVAGATRGAGRAIAVELSRAGAFVYATGRSSRVTGPSDMDRPETIEETGELMLATGGEGSALRVDHLLEKFGVTEENWRAALVHEPHFCISETPAYAARGIVALAADSMGRRQYAGKVLSSADLARIYGVTDIDETQPHCWRYVVEVQDLGLSATEAGYR